MGSPLHGWPDAGKITVGLLAAELVIEARAREVVKLDGCSKEVGYVRAMNEDLETAANAALG
jgi:hypothetical protein